MELENIVANTVYIKAREGMYTTPLLLSPKKSIAVDFITDVIIH